MSTTEKHWSGHRLALLFGLAAFIVIAFYIVYPIFLSGKPVSERTQCLSNVKQMILASILYANDYDDRFEKSDAWMDSTLPYAKDEKLFHDPIFRDGKGYGYAFRGLASGIKTDDLTNPAPFFLIFDSTLSGRNAHGKPSSIPRPGRHGNDARDTVGFADGHAKGFSTKLYDSETMSPLEVAVRADEHVSLKPSEPTPSPKAQKPGSKQPVVR